MVTNVMAATEVIIQAMTNEIRESPIRLRSSLVCKLGSKNKEVLGKHLQWIDVILGDVQNINSNLNDLCYMEKNGEGDNVGKQHIRSKRSWKDMAQDTAGVKTFGSGAALKAKSWRCSKEAETRGKPSATFEQFCIHCNSHIFFINIETIDILLTQWYKLKLSA